MATKLQKNQIATTLLDGWTPADATWTYASASTITVPSGAASIYQKGDRVKLTQTTVKYFVIVAVADTVLTFAVNTDYTVANAAITLNYYSHQANPLGYPHWFTWAPTLAGGTSPAANSAYFKVDGNTMWLRAQQLQLTSNATTFTFTVPVAVHSNSPLYGTPVFVADSNTNQTVIGNIEFAAGATTISAYKTFYTGAWTASGTKSLYMSPISYQF